MIGTKSKRNSLKASLERLIEEYLERLSSTYDDDSDNQRQRRFLENSLDDNSSESHADDIQRIELASVNINSSAEDTQWSEEKSDKYARVTHDRAHCNAIKTRHVQLDRFELDRALENTTDEVHNIRRVLNYR